MSSGASGSDEKISGSKIDPLASDIKDNVPKDLSSRGAAGSDHNIDQARIDPLGGKGVFLLPFRRIVLLISSPTSSSFAHELFLKLTQDIGE